MFSVCAFRCGQMRSVATLSVTISILLAILLLTKAKSYNDGLTLDTSNYHINGKSSDLIGSAISYANLIEDALMQPQQGPHTTPNLEIENMSNSKSSTCSLKATGRGPHQYVISFSFFGNVTHERDYFPGIAINAELMIKLYPNWVMRVYHDIPDAEYNQALKNITDKYGLIVDLCFAGNLPRYGNLLGAQQDMMWRFLTLTDPLVDVTLFRDLDSDLNERELGAVKEWLNSSYLIHIMRDHEEHDVPVLGGMWGANLTANRSMWNDALDRVLIDGRKAYVKGLDQMALADHVWPLAKTGLVMQHDSYFCKGEKYAVAGGMRPFPTCRITTSGLNFVGSRRTLDKGPRPTKTCPVECRLNKTCVTC